MGSQEAGKSGEGAQPSPRGPVPSASSLSSDTDVDLPWVNDTCDTCLGLMTSTHGTDLTQDATWAPAQVNSHHATVPLALTFLYGFLILAKSLK